MAQAKDDSAQPTPADEVPEEIVVEDDEIVVEEEPTTASATATATPRSSADARSIAPTSHTAGGSVPAAPSS